jgi:hypothetical protein
MGESAAGNSEPVPLSAAPGPLGEYLTLFERCDLVGAQQSPRRQSLVAGNRGRVVMGDAGRSPNRRAARDAPRSPDYPYEAYVLLDRNDKQPTHIDCRATNDGAYHQS